MSLKPENPAQTPQNPGSENCILQTTEPTVQKMKGNEPGSRESDVFLSRIGGFVFGSRWYFSRIGGIP